jgi:hypothetical protein
MGANRIGTVGSERAPAGLRAEQVRLLYQQTPIALGVNIAVAGEGWIDPRALCESSSPA